MNATLPLADPLDRVSEALLAYVRGSMMGVIPRVELNFTRSPSDLPGTTPDNEWEITLVISAIEHLAEEDAKPVYKFRQPFSAYGPSKEVAINLLTETVRRYLVQEVTVREMELAAARSALLCIEQMPVLDTMWSDRDPQDGAEESSDIDAEDAPAADHD